MKESPQTRKLEQILRSSKLVAGGFMGDDSRSFNEVIETDCFQISKLGYTTEQNRIVKLGLYSAGLSSLPKFVENEIGNLRLGIEKGYSAPKSIVKIEINIVVGAQFKTVGPTLIGMRQVEAVFVGQVNLAPVNR